ncbi:hypothetical protein ACWGLF_20695 [Streptomyces puniciscabiei]
MTTSPTPLTVCRRTGARGGPACDSLRKSTTARATAEPRILAVVRHTL